MSPLRFRVVPGTYALSRLATDATVPPWADQPPFSSVTRTPSELSIVCRAELVPESIRTERGWGLIELVGAFPFSAVGICAEITGLLARAGISLIALATFDTDYFLVQEADLPRALAALAEAGHRQVEWPRRPPRALPQS